MTSLDATVDLLNVVFSPDLPIETKDLQWYYHGNPEGSAAIGRVDENLRQIGNYALIPIRFGKSDGTVLRIGLGVDLAVHPETRGTGTFRQTIENSYEQARAAGLDGILGIANQQSAPRMVDSMGWRRLHHLPIRLLNTASHAPDSKDILVTSEFLNSETFESWLSPTTVLDSPNFSPTTSAEILRWRLARPRATYTLHLLEKVLLVSTRTRLAGLPIALLLKALPRGKVDSPLPTGPLAAVIARFHQTPFVLHWGCNSLLRLRGIPLPHRLMPSPLEIVLFSLHENFNANDFELSSFEFFDFDAF